MTDWIKKMAEYKPKPCYSCPINMRCPDKEDGCEKYREWKEKNHE